MSEKKRKGEWGGKREGAGRPPLPPGEKMIERTVTLPPELVEQLEALGEGNLSAGIREAARRLFGGPVGGL